MNTPVLTFFNNKGGVGKTSLIYHLAWTFANLGKQVVTIDLDPQANLTAAFLDEDKIAMIWQEKPEDNQPGNTIYQCVQPIIDVHDIAKPVLQNITPNLDLLPGDVDLSGFEDTLSGEWPNSMGSTNLHRPMRILSAFWQIMQMASTQKNADLILVDIGPNLGAINRSVLLATDYVVIPLGADLFSLQGLKNLGPQLRSWQRDWKKRLDNWKESNEKPRYPDFQLPKGQMKPIGYLCQQHSVRLDRPVKAYEKWVQRFPQAYREFVLEEAPPYEAIPQDKDSYCLSTIKHYRSLIPMAMEHRKPIFDLSSADGAIGAHANAVRDAREDFERLAKRIAHEMGMTILPEDVKLPVWDDRAKTGGEI